MVARRSDKPIIKGIKYDIDKNSFKREVAVIAPTKEKTMSNKQKEWGSIP